MYINFWYPIIRSEDLSSGKPERVKVLGVNLVVFRDDDGKAAVLSDTCVHRGGSLGGEWSAGNAARIVNGCVVCPYHGWEYDRNGKCVNIPSIGYETKTPARAKVDAYPVQEKYGIVFAFLGDLPEKDRPPLLDVKEYGRPGWRANTVLTLDVEYYYERSIENGLDPAHNEFVHPTHGFSAINRDTYRVQKYETEDHQQGWGMWFMHRFDAPPLPQSGHPTAAGKTPWGQTKTKRSDVYAGGGSHGPNTLITHITLQTEPEHKGFRQYFFEQPIDKRHTRIFFLNMRDFMLEPEHDGPIHARNKVIAQQDINILGDIYPRRTPNSSARELLMPSDKAVAAYRQWLNRFDEKGWRIDWEAFRSTADGDVAYAIPSPARRAEGNWVLESIPCLAANNQENTKHWATDTA